MNKLVKLVGDLLGLIKICGLAIALKWLFQVLLHFSSIMKNGNLQPADRAMGLGPFEVTLKRYNCRFKITGEEAFSGIREMYVRDVYLRNGWLTIKPHDTVVDLGANMGNFTNMALAIDPTVRVISVEPNIFSNGVFNKSVGLNAGHLARVTLTRAFLGQANPKSKALVAGDENYADAEWLTENQLIERMNIQSIDFLKCDIEGGEFGLLTTESKLLAMTKALAIEVHAFAGDVTKFMADIESCGFIIGPVQTAPDGTATFLAKRIV